MKRMEVEEMDKILKQLPPTDPELKEKIFTEYIRGSYIIYEGKKNRAACTRCGHEWELAPGEYARMHGLKDECPCCGEECILLSAGRGRNCYEEYHSILSYEEAEGTIYGFLDRIIARFEEMGRPSLYHSLDQVFIINKDRQERWDYKCSYYGDRWFERVDSMNVQPDPHAPYYASKWRRHVYADKIEEIVRKSDCKYLAETGLLHENTKTLPRYLSAMLKYHSVELLAKAGFTEIAQHKIDGYGCRSVNWRANSLEKILRLPREDIRRLREWNPTCSDLEAYKRLSEEERRIVSGVVLRDMVSYDRYDYTTRITSNNYREQVEEYMPFDKWLRWIRTQDRYKDFGGYYPYLLRDYKDYMKNAEKLGMDIHKKSILRPKDLKQAHDDAVNQVNVQRDALIEKAISENARSEEFRFGKLMIIPARTQEDLNKESAHLCHCVKTYGDRIAQGKCWIFFVRSTEEPDQPYYTLETKTTGEFVQCRGKHNCGMTDEVKLFTDSFVKKLKAEIIKETKEASCQTA